MKKNRLFFLMKNRIDNRVKIFCLGIFLSVSAVAFAVTEPASVQVVQQSKTVTGIVVDESGEPVIGATVKVGGNPQIGTITDIDGRFSIIVPTGSKLTVSSIGYATQTISVRDGDNKVVLKEDTQSLDEVVVVGYGTQKMKNVTGSITQVSAKEIEDLPVSNLAEALSGQVVGLSVSGGSNRPGVPASLSIRQTFDYSKDGGNSNPLVIIDDVIQVDPRNGLPTLEQLNMLDASEVESITVLRDASAAIYGSRASQGAILIKTKRGNQGVPRISYSGKFGSNDAISHAKTMSAYEYGKFANSFLLAVGKAKLTDTNKLYSENELEAMKSLNYDWLKEAWSSASTMQHSLNVSGGTDRATYFAGGTFYDQGANLGDQAYEKWTFRAGTDVKLSSDLKLSASVSANQDKRTKSFTKTAGSISDSSYGSATSGESSDYLLLLHMPKYIPWSMDIEGEEYFISPALGPHVIAANATSNSQAASWNYYALLDNGSKQLGKTFSYNANFALTYAVPFIKGLSLRGTYSTSRSASDTEQIGMPFTLALAKNMIQGDNKHLYGENTTLADYTIKENTANTRVAYIDELTESTQANFYVNYERIFGLHDISAMASIERAESFGHSKQIYYEKPSTGLYFGTSASAGTIDISNTVTGKYESASLSYLGRISYSYADRYMAQFIFRADASTKFSPSNAWGYFPGLSLGWIASEESWFKDNVSWLDYLKIRASWGKTGKDNIRAWAYIQTYDQEVKGFQFGPNGGVYSYSLKPSVSPNRNIHWDTTNKYNLGFDTRYLDGRLALTMDFYYDKNTDILNADVVKTVGTPVTVGGAITQENFGRIDAYGAEFSIGWRDKIEKVNYNIGINLGFSGNEVKEWPELPYAYPSANTRRVGMSTITPSWGFKVWRGTSGRDGILRTDEDITAYWDYLTANANAVGGNPKYFDITNINSLKKGMLAYQDLGGALNTKDGTIAGPDGQVARDQDYAKLVKRNKSYGFTTHLGANWKGISFRAQISTSWGGDRNLGYMKIGTSTGHMLWSPEYYLKDMYDEYDNVSGKYPNIGYPDQNLIPSDYWSISSFRCYVKNMTIGYTLSKNWLKTVKIESARLSLTGTNLWDFYNPYPDNYRNMYDDQKTNYPTLRTWALGVNFTF